MSQKPLLLIVSPSAYPLGGVADWLAYLLPSLEQMGWQCVLGLVQGIHNNVDAYLAQHHWHHVVRIDNPTGSERGRINAMIRVIQQVRPNLLVAVNISAIYDAIRILRTQGSPAPRLAMALHGLQGDLLGDIHTAVDVLDAVVAPNQLAVRLASEGLGTAGRALYAPCGVLIQNHPSRSAKRAADQMLMLLYSGRLEETQKRVFDLPLLACELLARGVSFQISIAGGGPEEQALREKINELDVSNHFQFLGVLDPFQLSCTYREHDALIITSVWETGPIVAWEAMSYGLPVISSSYVGSGLEGALVHHGNCLIFPVGNMDAAACAVQSLANAGLVERLVQGGLDLVRTRYSRQTSVAMWDAAFRRVLALPALPAPDMRPPSTPSGRLDRWLGAAGGEFFRRALGVSYHHDGPGGEWPHTRQPDVSQDAFLARASALDQVTI